MPYFVQELTGEFRGYLCRKIRFIVISEILYKLEELSKSNGLCKYI